MPQIPGPAPLISVSPVSVLSIGTRLDVLPDLLKEITLLMDDNVSNE